MIFDVIQEAQRGFHDQIASSMNIMRDGGSWAAGATLITASFLYGILHAAGPGHGKVIVAGYMLADDGSLRRGLVITALSSLLQAVVAVVLVLGLFYGLGIARSQTELMAAWFETGSFALVALIGAALFIRGVLALRPKHGHVHVHGHDCGCGHNHGPVAADIKNMRGIGPMAAMIVSIGIRPCSGALLVMFFACIMGEITAGIAATFVMAIGTGITTSAIAIAAAHSRRGLLKLVGASELRIALASAMAKIAGGLLICALGVMFAAASAPSATQGVAAYRHPLMQHHK